MTVNLQTWIRQLTQAAELEPNELIREGLMAAAWCLKITDNTLNVSPEQKLETCLGYQLEDIEDDKDTNLLKKLGFTPHKKVSVLDNKKILFVTTDGIRIIFARNAYNEKYQNDAPFIGKNLDEINLVNECDYIVVARYESGSGKDADYVDGAAFDIHGVQLAINAQNQIEFLPPEPQNATIFVPQQGDWVKLQNLERKEV